MADSTGDFRHEVPTAESGYFDADLPMIPDDIRLPESATSANARNRFRLALLATGTYFPGRGDLLERGATWLYEDPRFLAEDPNVPWSSRHRPFPELNQRSLNIRKNKMARDPEHYLDDDLEVHLLDRANDSGGWITIDEAGTAHFVSKTRFEHGYLRHIHFVSTVEISLRRYEELFVNDWVRTNRPEFVYPPMKNFMNHQDFVGAAIEQSFFSEHDRRQSGARDKEAWERFGRMHPIQYLERLTHLELFRALGNVTPEDSIPPAKPEVESTVVRGEIEVSRRGLINLGPFERDLQEPPEEVGPEYRVGVEWHDEFLEILEAISEETES